MSLFEFTGKSDAQSSPLSSAGSSSPSVENKANPFVIRGFYCQHGRIFATEANQTMVQRILAHENKGELEQADALFCEAVKRYMSAKAWCDCASSFFQFNKHTEAAIAYMIAAGVSYQKKDARYVRENFSWARISFLKAKDSDRGKRCDERADELCADIDRPTIKR